ncbi:MAG: GNAT family N-acetyltransferase [Planctomycetota bacterium]|nr:GNAT family N-acetyltransferase [Planctomycetota bacterium]
MSPESPAFTVAAVDVSVVRPLRHLYLRPDQPVAAVAYKSDDCETCHHVAARDAEGTVIGVGTSHYADRVAGQPPFGHPGLRIRGMAVTDAWRSKGVGAALIAAMLEAGAEAGMVEAWANARTASLSFYRRHGFSEVSQVFELPTIGEHVVVAVSLAKWAKKAT